MGLLSRFRMLDLSRLFPGPMASHLLADMGMEVVKVEEPRPRYGMGRDILTPPDGTPEEEQRWAAYNSLARNKKSVALDLLDPAKRPRSQEVFYRLAEQADVVLEGYRPGAVQWMGVDYESVRRYNPRIIYCSISGYGQDGPYQRLPGHDAQYCAVAGIQLPRPSSDGPPSTHVPLGDVSSGMYAAMAILAALLGREETGEGQYIDVPMLGSVMSFQTGTASGMFRDGQPARQKQSAISRLTYLKCRDGKWLSTSNAETSFWENFCRVLDREEYIPLRGASGPEVDAMVEDVERIFLTKDRDEWLRMLWEADTCAAPLYEIGESMDDPQVRHLGLTWTLQHPALGEVRQMGFPIRFYGTPAEFQSFAPVLGQHTREVLAEAGFSSHEIAELEGAEIVKSWGEG